MSNPFDDPNNDPFKDPSVAEATLGPPIQEYNPFDEVPGVAPPEQAAAAAAFNFDTGASKSGTLTKVDPVPASHADITDDALRAREMEIARREAELEYRERKLKEREAVIATLSKPRNFPQCYPLIYHSIKEEIPEAQRPVVRKVFVSWNIEALAYTLNFIAVMFATFTGAGGGPGAWMAAALLFVVGPMGAFRFWYYPFYTGVRDGKSLRFFFFFFWYLVHMGLTVYLGIGLGDGGAGAIMLLDVLNGESKIAIVLCALSTGVWAINFFWSSYTLKQVHSFYRGWDKGSIQNAKKEFAQDVLAESAKAAV